MYGPGDFRTVSTNLLFEPRFRILSPHFRAAILKQAFLPGV